MKFLLYFFGVLICCWQTSSDSFEWTEEKLSWEDFKGSSPQLTGDNAAVSCVRIDLLDFKWSSKKGNGRVVARFFPKKSWTRLRTDELLSHEQGHFDLTEIYARLIRRELTKKRVTGQKLQQITNSLLDEWEQIQIRYDAETAHHKNVQKQLEWDRRISQDLKALERYCDSEITVNTK